jgi:hypothetical protein
MSSESCGNASSTRTEELARRFQQSLQSSKKSHRSQELWKLSKALYTDLGDMYGYSPGEVARVWFDQKEGDYEGVFQHLRDLPPFCVYPKLLQRAAFFRLIAEDALRESDLLKFSLPKLEKGKTILFALRPCKGWVITMTPPRRQVLGSVRIYTAVKRNEQEESIRLLPFSAYKEEYRE